MPPRSANELYKALAFAETGHLNEYDSWIRTEARGSGSSAYGPVQINKAMLTGPGYGDVGFSPEEESWIQGTYLPQMELFLKYGGDDMVEGKERYDYAQRGDFTASDRAMYKNMANKLINFEYNRNKGDMDSFIRAWRGETREDDPDYYDRVEKELLRGDIVNPLHEAAFTGGT